jgi:hypothetical protein
MSAAGASPVARRRLNLSVLTPDEFELLCFYVVAIDEPEVIRVANPDGGADAALRRADGSWERCWQHAEALERFMRHGGDIELPNVKVEYTNLPAAFSDITPAEHDATVSLQAPRVSPAPMRARFTIAESSTVDPLEVHLEPTDDVHPDWDGALAGTVGGLTVRINFRVRGGRGEIMVDWTYIGGDGSPVSVRAAQLAFIEALHHRGVLAMDDVTGRRPRLTFDMTDQPVDPVVKQLRALLEDIAVIEKWAGRQLDPPEKVHSSEVQALREMAEIVRDGEARMNFERVTLEVPEERWAEARRGEGDDKYLLEMEIGLAVLGTEIAIGKLRGELTAAEVTTTVGDVDESGLREVRLEPRTKASAHPVFKLVR